MPLLKRRDDMKKDKKRKQFYNNKNRNTHWTEEPKGRPIDFADKYDSAGGYSDKYNETSRNLHRLAMQKIERREKRRKTVICIVLAVVLICTGYIAMDVRIIRNARPIEELVNNASSSNGALSQTDIQLYAMKISSVSMDNSVMLDSVINDVGQYGFNSVVFDAKRSDGTIGYRSSLAAVDTYGAMSNVGVDSVGSVQKLIENDILPVARICCYVDNVVAIYDSEAAVMNGNSVYRDKDGDAYLNPDSEVAYGYIRDIVRELYDFGVRVFVLYGCDLPSTLSGYNDGFATIAQRLSEEMLGDIKLIEETPRVRISGIEKTEDGEEKISNTAIVQEIQQLTPLKENSIYYISSDIDKARLTELLNENGVNNFILE